MSLTVKTEKIYKSFGDLRALENISMQVQANELFGLIGPDGAGKTTLFRIIASLLKPSEGKAFIGDFDCARDLKSIRKIIGYMPGQFSLYYDLSVIENLKFYASIFNTTIDENYHLIKNIYSQIEAFKNRPAGKLSGGMKQKLALSCALIHKPKVLLLDEPTTGVDAVSRMEFWELLKELQKKEITIIVSTPYMDEASLCDRVALINNGKILRVNKPELIEAEYPYPIYEVKGNNLPKLSKDLDSFHHIVSNYRFGDSIHITIENKEITERNIINYLNEIGYENCNVKKINANIEDSFLLLDQK